MSDYPRMTYYARVLDNVTGDEIINFTDATKSNYWYYGRCNGLEGGESEYIVEFDIWNNEPAFEGGTRDVTVANAENCRFTVWPDDACIEKIDNPLFNLVDPNNFNNPVAFMHARCDTFGYKEEWMPIRNNLMLENITGNVNANNQGVIEGTGDHARVQTKIVIPTGTKLLNGQNISKQRYGFVFAFYYDFK